MRRSAAALLGIAGGLAVGTIFARRRGLERERVDLYYGDGSMVSLDGASPDADRLLTIARELLAGAR